MKDMKAEDEKHEAPPQVVDAEVVDERGVDRTHPPGYVSVSGSKLMEEKHRLLVKHHGGSESLANRVRTGEISPEEAMNAIIVDLLGETDSLKGSELLFAQEGNLRDATTVTVKRVEALEKVAKTLHRRHLMMHEEIINLDSPYVRLIVSWFLRKINDCLRDLNYPQEAVDVFFGKLQLLTDNWKRDVKREMQALQEQKGTDEGGDGIV